MIGLADYGFFHDFADDDMAFRVRRAGYKAILCKDVFVQHAGQSAVRTEEESRDYYNKSRAIFSEKYFGIDAWDDVNNYELTMMSCIVEDDKFVKETPNVLGVDVLCGTPILEVKNIFREKGIFGTKLSAFSTEAKYWLDLKTICDGRVQVDRIDYVSEHFNNNKFDVIVLGKPINTYKQPQVLLKQLLDLLATGGQLLLKLRNTQDIRTLLKILGLDSSIDNEYVQHISVEEFSSQMNQYGYYAKTIKAEPYIINDNIKSIISNIKFNTEHSRNNLAVRDYIFYIMQK